MHALLDRPCYTDLQFHAEVIFNKSDHKVHWKRGSVAWNNADPLLFTLSYPCSQVVIVGKGI